MKLKTVSQLRPIAFIKASYYQCERTKCTTFKQRSEPLKNASTNNISSLFQVDPLLLDFHDRISVNS